METPNKPPMTALTEWLNSFPETERNSLARRALLLLKQESNTTNGDDEPEIEYREEYPEIDGDAWWEELLADPRSEIALDMLAEESKEERRNGTVLPLREALKKYAYLLEEEQTEKNEF